MSADGHITNSLRAHDEACPSTPCESLLASVNFNLAHYVHAEHWMVWPMFHPEPHSHDSHELLELMAAFLASATLYLRTALAPSSFPLAPPLMAVYRSSKAEEASAT